ncbi:YidC/Oxa1 family membrane protein insertase [Luteimonas sp. J16]|uniref:membrane protein insertase YidC n=1 Tax=unclassified Luteimonas TaxID=2629088 RepID=UPI00047C4B0E|nr:MULTISPECIES: membrane protein insertase YidC [unclassified Luteimonas]TWG90919.1 YidC/Oxa1 family membrane protein insertase [Luteimonas sp. J16]
MNQTRTFLILAWLMVAVLLWMEWNKERSAPPPAATAQVQVQDAQDASIPAAPAAAPAGVPQSPPVPPGAGAESRATPAPGVVQVETDVLRLLVDGGSVLRAELLQYPQTRDPGSPPVVLFDNSAAGFYAAQSGWVSASGGAPNHQLGFVPAGTERSFVLGPGESQVVVPFVWEGPDGVTIRRSYVLERGQYAVTVRDEIVNAGSEPWQGYAYRQLMRGAPNLKRGMTNPESFSLTGATWFGDSQGYLRRWFSDYDDGPVRATDTNTWIAFVQHHFFGAWLPGDNAGARNEIALDTDLSGGAPRYFIREMATAPVVVAPGQQAGTSARLWVGPKLVNQIKAQQVPGLERVVDYSRFSVMAWLGEGLFWVLEKLHRLFGNWGWAIVGLVVLVKILLFPLANAQYKSMAKMRKFQPRLQQLKERYGDDRQKFQVAMMELYKKEKINPVGGCLPVLLQMPIFFALYWVLLESVELRHAPWIGWIQDLTARDPWFILPVINVAVMWATQKLSPMTGMDPMQQRMMQMMPIVFGVMMVFFPAGLVLYWVVNGGLGLLQQWYMLRKYADAPAKA